MNAFLMSIMIQKNFTLVVMGKPHATLSLLMNIDLLNLHFLTISAVNAQAAKWLQKFYNLETFLRYSFIILERELIKDG